MCAGLCYSDGRSIHVLGLLQEFNAIEAAQALMDSDARDTLSLYGKPLTLNYSVSQQGSKGSQASNLADWICTMCQAINFAR